MIGYKAVASRTLDPHIQIGALTSSCLLELSYIVWLDSNVAAQVVE